MNKLFSKSASRLLKNSSISSGDYRLDALLKQIGFVLTEQRAQRSDLQSISRKIDRLLIDKHLQMQVDEYFADSEQTPFGRQELEDK